MDAYLVVNGFAFNKPWCHISDYSDIFGRRVKGRNRPIPGAAGSRSYPRYMDERVLQFPVEVYGGVDDAGATITDKRQGLIDHCDFLENALGIADPLGDVEAVFHEFDGGTRSAWVQPSLPDFRTIGVGAGRYVLELVVPAGVFELVGS